MLSLDTIFVPRWWKKFSEATGVHLPLPREYSGRNAAREDFSALRVFSHTAVHNVVKIFSDPQNEHPGEWRPPRPLHALLRANREPIRPISESCWWSGTRSAPRAPAQRRAVPGEGRASVRFFSTSVALGRDSLCRTESEKGARLGVPGPQERRILAQTADSAPGCILEDVLENRSPSPSLLGWAKTFLPRPGRHDNMLSPAHCDALWCRDSFRSRRGEEISGPIGAVPPQPSCGDSGPAAARSRQTGKNPPIWSSFVKSRRKVSDHLHWCGPISRVRE